MPKSICCILNKYIAPPNLAMFKWWSSKADRFWEDIMKEIFTKFFTVKSFITILLSIVFSILSIKGTITSDQFLMIFTTIIAFYFGTQHDKKGDK